MSGLEGLVEAPESALLEGFGRIVASTAAAHLEGLKQRGTVRAARRARRAKVASGSPRFPPSVGRPEGIEQLGRKAVYGLRGSKEGGVVQYFCKEHDHSTGSFRINRDRASWVEMWRIKAELARLKAELREFGGAPSSAEKERSRTTRNAPGQNAMFYDLTPKSIALIGTLLATGCVELNPGPVEDEVSATPGTRNGAPLVHLSSHEMLSGPEPSSSEGEGDERSSDGSDQ
ncbi:hypothetical protein KFL_008400020 [Klebsormidium nitens]|uniref:Uncharacterized protein n=1 Tax=Klebsormidium nitens TaxID=105231 RepID=A0A1Y1ILQ3_KLENI|nr:hypothetical protein KFL_008400020 [Klebsormidium nitens]|eukprot:GAQ91724.1 hypothetical protein KFL_008400020 [Klebsormidium nitens]